MRGVSLCPKARPVQSGGPRPQHPGEWGHHEGCVGRPVCLGTPQRVSRTRERKAVLCVNDLRRNNAVTGRSQNKETQLLRMIDNKFMLLAKVLLPLLSQPFLEKAEDQELGSRRCGNRAESKHGLRYPLPLSGCDAGASLSSSRPSCGGPSLCATFAGAV